MILRLGYEVFPKIGRLSLTNPYLDYVYSINLEEAPT
jgi:hypothetical protein